MLLQMRDVFQKDDFVVERDVVEEDEVLVQLPHVAYVGNDRQAKLLGHQTHGEKFAHPRKARAVRLNEMHACVMEEVLEEDAVWDVFPCGNSYGRDLRESAACASTSSG